MVLICCQVAEGDRAIKLSFRNGQVISIDIATPQNLAKLPL